MDLNDYISSINKDIQKDLEYLDRMQNDFLDNILKRNGSEITPDIDNLLPRNSQAPTPEIVENNTIARLILDRRLEESCKSKIGTFETIYNETFVEDTGMPIASYGFCDLDYSPLVSLLVSILEIELNLSVYQCIRQRHGIDLKQFFDKKTTGRRIHVGDKVIELGESKQMLRTIHLLIIKERDYLSKYIKDIEAFIDIFSKCSYITYNIYIPRFSICFSIINIFNSLRSFINLTF